VGLARLKMPARGQVPPELVLLAEQEGELAAVSASVCCSAPEKP